MSCLLDALADYDVKSKDLLIAIRDGIEPVGAILDDAIALSAYGDDRIATGASWLLRAWIEGGAAISAAAVGRLAATLEDVRAHWARLHVCQTVRSLRIPETATARLAAFLERCLADEKPLLRAWAIDGFHHLAAQHAGFAARAAAALAAGHEDPAPSVRARARILQARR